MQHTRQFLLDLLKRRFGAPLLEWCQEASEEIAGGVSDTRFASLISLASRYAPRRLLEPDSEDMSAANDILDGFNPECWTALETVRVALILARSDLDEESAEQAIEETFRYADEGELRALYRSLAHLPSGERFVWRAAEGCRTNIVPVFEAVACDTPFPTRFFDDLAWRQLVIKAVFIEAPLWRVYGLDDRLCPELARMALDLVDERRSAGRAVQHELWLCLGVHGGERGFAALERELEEGAQIGRRAAALAMGRAARLERVAELHADEQDAAVKQTMQLALSGRTDQWAFRALDSRSN